MSRSVKEPRETRQINATQDYFGLDPFAIRGITGQLGKHECIRELDDGNVSVLVS